MRPEARTKKGIYVGAQEEGVSVFRGIPFAQPPVGKLRWREPLELPDSGERFDALEDGPIPVQVEDERYNDLPQSEDCLTLNIFTADLEKKDKSVLVWVYGGAYIKGGIARRFFDGDLLVKEYPDVLFVSINYRVGVFGTLNLSKLDRTGEYRFSNNLARLDFQAALKWIHENISAFGGDPGNVTIWGHSAGSSNISAQLMMEGSRPYFQKAIMHSSFAVDIGTTSWEDSLGAADAFFDILGNPTLEELLAIPAADILAAQIKLQRSDFFNEDRKPFSVVLDDIVIPSNAFQTLCEGAAKGIDAIIGSSWGEYDQQFRPLDMEGKYKFLRGQCGSKAGDLDGVIRFYQEQAPKTPLDEIYMDIKNDLWMRIPANLTASALCEHSNIYVYYDMLRKANGIRAHHGAEYETILGRQDRELVPEDFAPKFQKTFLEFVRKGKPASIGGTEWPCYDAAHRQTLAITETPYIAEGIRVNDMELLLPRFRENSCL